MGESILAAVLSAAEPVSWVLLHSLWVGGVIAIILAIVTNFSRGRTPQIRYALAGLAMMLVLPVSVSIVVYDSINENIPVYLESPAALDNNGQAEPVPAQATTQESPTVLARLTELSNVDKTEAAPWICLAWICGIIGLSLYHLVGWSHARKLVRLSSQPVSDAWRRRFRQLCHRAGVGRAIELLSSTKIKMPCVVGWAKPTILMPVSVFSGLSTEDIDMILAHELAHINRHDVLINYAQTVIETLLFFNPAIWWISRQIRTERENCCDDIAAAITDGRLAYARALANLEGLRSVRLRLVSAADGTSLVKRVRRLIGTNVTSPQWPGFRAVSALSLAAIVTVSVSVMATLSSVNAADDENYNASTVYQEKDDDLHGYWDMEPNDDGVSLRMKFRRSYQTSFSFYPEEFDSFKAGDNVQFKLIRDAGTFFFEGDVEDDGGDYYGKGECHFRADPDYVKEMEKLGYRIKAPQDMLALAIHNVELAFARGIHDAGYERLSLDKLLELHIHRVTPEFIAELAELGYRNLSLDRLVEMRIHRATPEYIRDLTNAGYTNLDAEDLVTMRIHRVDPDYIRGFSELGLDKIRAEKLVEMSIHNVSPSYVRELKKLGFDNVDPSKLVEMRIHRVEPEYIGRLVELGLKDIDLDDLVAMRIHGVETGYVEKLKELGYDDISPDDLVAMRIHDVTIEFIEKLQARGYDDLTPDRLVSIRIHGLDRERSRRRTSY